MQKKINPTFIIALILLAAFASYGAWELLQDKALPPKLSNPEVQGVPPRQPLVFYTASGATTPQLPLLALEAEGFFANAGYQMETRRWKNMDDLRGVILADQGDIWLGHLEGFAQAYARGGQLCVVAVTGWTKFYALSADPMVNSLEDMAKNLQASGKPLSVAPADGPAMPLLAKINTRLPSPFILAGKPSQQVSLELLRGDIDDAVLPEPLVSLMLSKRPDLHVVAGLESTYAQYFGGKPRLPTVGLAVHRELAAANPQFVRNLALAMTKSAAILTRKPELGVTLLQAQASRMHAENQTQDGVLSPEILLQSFTRDNIAAYPAQDVRTEIQTFLQLAAPQTLNRDGSLPDGFIFMMPSAPTAVEQAN